MPSPIQLVMCFIAKTSPKTRINRPIKIEWTIDERRKQKEESRVMTTPTEEWGWELTGM